MLTGLLLTACPQHFRNRDTVSVRLWFPSVNCSRTWVLCMVAYSGAYISSTSPFLTLVTTELMTHRVGFLKIINWLLLPHYKGQDGRTCGAIFVPAPLTHCLYSCEPVFFKCFFHFLHCNFRFSHHHIFQLDEKKKKTAKHTHRGKWLLLKNWNNNLVWLSLWCNASEFLKVLLPHQLWVVISTFQFL